MSEKYEVYFTIFFTASASILEVALKDAKNRVEVKIGQRFF